MPKAKKLKRKPPTRTRTRKREIFLSESEDRIFARMLKRRGQNASQCFRDMLARAEAQYKRRKGKASPPVDKRQLTIAEAS